VSDILPETAKTRFIELGFCNAVARGPTNEIKLVEIATKYRDWYMTNT